MLDGGERTASRLHFLALIRKYAGLTLCGEDIGDIILD
jgi:hypothetical protein